MDKRQGAKARGKAPVMGLCALAVLALVTAIALNRPDSTAGDEARASSDHGEHAEAPPASEPAADGASDAAAPTDSDAESSEQFGWGASQPHQMRATVHYGGSSEPISPERRELLGRQLQEARDAALAIGTVAEAEALGFVKNFQRIDGRGFEYINWSRFSDTLDLAKPTMLLFADDEPDSRVISMAYNVLGTIDAGPPTDLPLEAVPWHYHSSLCKKGDSVVGSVEYGPSGEVYQDQIERCDELGAVVLPELNHWMVDLWVIPGWENPWGLVSSKHPDQFSTPQPWFEG